MRWVHNSILAVIFSCCLVLSGRPPVGDVDAQDPAPGRLNLQQFVLPGEHLVKDLEVDFGDGTPGWALAYGIDDKAFVTTGVRILRYSEGTWRVTFEELESVINGAGAIDAIDLLKFTSTTGQAAVVVVLKNSGAGTSTDWHVLCLVKGRILALDPGKIRDKVLKQQRYVFQGYNGVTTDHNLVVEHIPGYSPGQARCCPDKPSVEMSIRFTGSSLELASVKKLPF